MAEEHTHLIKIIVTALNKAGAIGDQVAKEVEKATGAQDRHTKSVKSNEDAIKKANAEYARFVKEVKDGGKDFDEAKLGLSRLAGEFDRLARKQPIGSTLSEDLNRSAIAARNLIEQLKTARETERKLNEQAVKDRVRQEEERQKITQKTIELEIKEEERGVKARSGLLGELLDAVREDNEARIAFNRDLTRREIEEDRRRTKARIDEAEKAAQQVADISRRTDVEVARPSLGQRIAGFFGRGDDGVRRFVQDLTSLGRTSNDTERRVSRLDRTLDRLHGTANNVGFSVARVDNNLRGLLIIGVVAFSQQLISSLIALGTTLFAVASTAVQAGAAIGGAFVAAAGQAVPAIGLLIAAFGRIGAVFDAVKLFNDQAVRSGRDQAAAADAQAAAADRVVSAQEGVTSAIQRVQDATESLIEARKAAIRNIEDLNLAERRASLTAFESQRALSQAVATGDLGALESLRIQSDEGRLGARRATSSAQEARTQGAEGSDEVRQAIRTLDDANVALGRARREMEAANRAATRAAEGTSSADQALTEALTQLTPAERALYESIKRIQTRFKVLFRPITDVIVGAFTDAVNRVGKVMSDARVVEPLRRIAEALATSIRRVTAELTSSRALDFFKVMGEEASRNLPLVTDIFIRLSRIMSVVAQAAGPALRAFLEFLDDLVTKGDKATSSKSGLGKLERFFLRGEEYAESFAKLTLAIINLFLALAGAGGAETGQNAIDKLTEQVKKATDWVNDNRDKVKQFFSDSLDAAEAIASSLFKIGRAATTVFDSKSVQDFAKAFNDVILPALTDVVLTLGSLTRLMTQFLDLPVVGSMVRWVVTIALVSKAFRVLGGLIEGLVGAKGLVTLLSRLPLIGKAFRALAIGIRVAAAVLAGPWGIAIAAVITAIVLLDRKFHFIQPTIKFLGRVLEDVLVVAFEFLKDAALDAADTILGFFTMFAGGISTIASALSFLPAVGDKFKDLAENIDKGREVIDGWRESLRAMREENEKAPSKVAILRKEITELRTRMSKLKEGTDEYRGSARTLEVKQEALNKAMAEAESKGKKGARGPRAIGSSARSAAKAVDDANESIVKGYNTLASQLGGIKKITYTASGVTVRGREGSLTTDTGDILARATGGFIGRSWGPQGPDDQLILAGKREAIINEPQQGVVDEGLTLRSMLMGGPGSLTELFQRFGGAFAEGGVVGRVDLKGAGEGLRRFAIDAMRYGLNVTSGLRQGAITSSGNRSLHSLGDAVDLAGSARDMLRYAAHAVRSYGRQLAELIHSPLGYGVKGGKRVPLSFFGAKVISDHYDHVHLGYTGAGGGGIEGLVDQLARQRIRGPTGAMRSLAQRAVDRVRNAANDRLGDVAIGPEMGVGRTATSTRPDIVRNIALGQRMARELFGWVGQQWQALKTLWQGESGWDARVVNKSSGAGGIPQALPASKMGPGWLGRAAQQIRWGLGYIKDRYDTPARALAAWAGRSPHWYQSGGFVGRAARRVYTTPTIFNTSLAGVLGQLRSAQETIGALTTRGPRFVRDFERSLRAITDDGGLLDQARTAIQRVVDSMALRLRQATFRVTRSGIVVRRLTPEQQSLASVASIDEQREGLQSLRSATLDSLENVNARLQSIQRGGVSARERKAYETLVTARRTLLQKLQDVDVAIADAVEARFSAQENFLQSVIDAIDRQAQRTFGRADLADRIANVIQAQVPSLTQASFALRGGALQARGNALIGQRDQLGQAVQIANLIGRQDLVPDLIARIEDLNVQLFENAAAIRANTTAARQAQIDAIVGRGSFRTGLASSLASLVQTAGQVIGTVDVDRVRSLTEAAGITLRSTGEALRQQLTEAFGIDLRGLNPTALSDAVRNINFDAIEAGLSTDQQQQFQNLISAIVDNAGAVVQNTQALQDLNQTQAQSFSSSLWQLFRRAVFTGSGGLLPQYQIPALQSGGMVMSSGLIYAHAGEPILPASVTRDWSGAMSGDTNNVYITTPTEVADPGYIAEVLSFKRSQRRAT